jgi:hypothetical protein
MLIKYCILILITICSIDVAEKTHNNYEDFGKFYEKLTEFRRQVVYNERINSLEKDKLLSRIDEILISNHNKKNEINHRTIKLSDVTILFNYLTLEYKSDRIETQKNTQKLYEFLLVNRHELSQSGVRILISFPSNFTDKQLLNDLSEMSVKLRFIRILKLNSMTTKWNIFNYILNFVDTDFLFLAENFEPFNRDLKLKNKPSDIKNIQFLTNIRILLANIQRSKSTALVSAGYRNSDKQLLTDCSRLELKYYGLKYVRTKCNRSSSDYFHSGGLFLIRTKVLITLLKTLMENSDTLFYIDLYLELRQNKFSISFCEDIYFNLNSNQSNLGDYLSRVNEKEMQNLMKKYEIELIEVRDMKYKLEFKYKVEECDSINLACFTGSQSKHIALPRCCRKYLSHGLKLLDEHSRANSIDCELDSGSMVGAVKFAHVLPWEIDGDINYDNKKHEKLKKALNHIKKITSYSFGREEKATDKKEGYFQIYPGPFFIELFGMNRLNIHSLTRTDQNLNATLIFIDNKWITAKNSPGLYVRNRYGRNIYKHSLSWRYLGLQHSFDNYSNAAEMMNALLCPRIGYHACMSSLRSDGNYEYLDFD